MICILLQAILSIIGYACPIPIDISGLRVLHHTPIPSLASSNSPTPTKGTLNPELVLGMRQSTDTRNGVKGSEDNTLGLMPGSWTQIAGWCLLLYCCTSVFGMIWLWSKGFIDHTLSVSQPERHMIKSYRAMLMN